MGLKYVPPFYFKDLMGQVPYHGPYIVLSLEEAAAIKKYYESHPEDGIQLVDDAIEKITWALEKSHPKFLDPSL